MRSPRHQQRMQEIMNLHMTRTDQVLNRMIAKDHIMKIEGRDKYVDWSCKLREHSINTLGGGSLGFRVCGDKFCTKLRGGGMFKLLCKTPQEVTVLRILYV